MALIARTPVFSSAASATCRTRRSTIQAVRPVRFGNSVAGTQLPCSPNCSRAHNCSKRAARVSHIMQAIGIFFSTSTGNTEEVANLIKAALGDAAAEPQEIGDVADLASLKEYDGLIVGAPTWNTGSPSQRSGTSWDDLLEKLAALDLAGKPVACFGCGDSISYGEYFVDAMEELHSTFSAAGATMVGHWPTKGYDHHESKAEIEKGVFCGLPLDQDNQPDLTEGRVNAWTAKVLQEMKVNVA